MRKADKWTRSKPITIKELDALRAKTVKSLDEAGQGSPASFTCDDCSWATVCKLVFDPYNTNGDCLWEK